MTKDEIMNMSAGQEMDTLVAEKVMKFHLDYEFADMLGAPTVKELGDKYDEWGLLPLYSTEIDAAWEVVEKLKDRWGIVNIEYSHSAPIARERWTAYFDIDFDGFMGFGDTAPLAICRAALLATL
jgi:hypothetical protein